MESLFDTFSLLGCAGIDSYGPSDKWGGKCPYCLSRLTTRPFDIQRVSEMYRNRGVGFCELCGFWEFSESGDTCNTPTTTYFCSILQTFDLRSAAVPIDVLELELKKWIEKIGYLNPRRMEDIVGRILSAVWACEVRHVGYTRDGGTDLLILDGETPIAVQVKRRASPQKPELVNGIREFLGAALLSGNRRLMYVTTAEKFSKGAVGAATDSQNQGLVESFELVSMNEIRRFLPAMPNENPWDFAVRRANAEVCKVPQVPNPYSFIEPMLFPELAKI